jgi:serine/threonine protein kinase
MGTRRPGDSIANRYRILDTLGQGGMGTVHLAKDRLGGMVALKRLGTQTEPEHFEAAAAAGMDPPGPRPRASSAISPDAPTRVSSEPVPLLAPSAFKSTLFDLGHVGAATSRAPHPDRVPRSTRAPESSVLLRETDAPNDDLAELLRLTLAREFHLLASLRHPNIISVLDYGFDDDLSPYFTMELLQGAETIMSAGAGRSVDERVDLLAQMLQALAYLHRRGVIHRDLKPGNVLVVDGKVKVLDFGVSTQSTQASASTKAARRDDRGGIIVGTLAYMAPEMLSGGNASEASDLYAVGTIAYELFAGHYPFRLDELYRLRDDILHRAPDLSAIDPRLRPVVGHLLEKRPSARPESVDEVFAELAERTGRPLQVETVATRESFLQAAELVGRDRELGQLSAMLTAAMTGKGGGALVGGESGVGKSRLLDELRARALVDGMVVLRGQATDTGSAGSGPYHVFREVLRGMALSTDLDDFEAGVLQAVVPDLAALIEREVPVRAEIDPEAAHRRLFAVIEGLFARQTVPVLVILEDLHWAGSESLRLLAHLSGRAATQPVLFVGSYRDDERPDLPREVPLLRVLKLGRLTGEGIAALAASMLGEAGRRPWVVDRLHRETEGNPFFLVEVVRALAEDAGALSRVGIEPMPATLPAGGVHLIVRRRLDQVPRRARPLLEAAAVIGRRLDPALLRRLDPAADVEALIRTCANVAVLDVSEGGWRFAHDKLREGLLSALSVPGRVALHRRVAAAIEAEYGDAPEQTMALAHHWAQAGDTENEARYSALAGEQALQSSDYAGAAAFFERAIAIVSASSREAQGWRTGRWGRAREAIATVLPFMPEPVAAGSQRFRLGLWEGRLTEVYGRMSNVAESARHGGLALAYLGRPMPKGSAGLVAGLPVQAALRGLMALSPAAFAEASADGRAVLSEATRIHTRLAESCFYTQEAIPLFFSGLSTLNLGEPAGPSADLARAYAVMAPVAGIVPLHAMARAWSRRAFELVEQVGKPYDVGFVLQRISAYRLWMGEWDLVAAGIAREKAIAREVGDVRLLGDALSIQAFSLLYQGRFTSARAHLAELDAWMRHTGNAELVAGALVHEAMVELRCGGVQRALAVCREAQPQIEAMGVSHGLIRHHGVWALAHLAAGDRESARDAADRAVRMLAVTRPVAFWTLDGVAATAETALALWESSGDPGDARRAKQACDAARAYAQIFPIGRPFALLWEGLSAQLAGEPRRARLSWERCVAESERLGMPYERARAFREIGRRLPHGDPERRRLLGRAEAIFGDLGAQRDQRSALDDLRGG